jgi:protein-tyrosine kinase
MSRLDRALQAWEGTNPTEPQAERFTLDQYLREGPTVNGPASGPSSTTQPSTTQPSTTPVPPTESAASPLTTHDESSPRPAYAREVEPLAATAEAALEVEAARRENRRDKKYDPDIDARLVTGGSGSVPLEQYRRLAAVLHDVQLQQGLKTLMLTSALPGEGKTLTTVNLALTLSESYARRVLIIDADLRWPSIHTVFGLPNQQGLSEALQGQQFDLPIRQLTPRFAVLTAGRPGQTPLAGLTSVRMARLIDECAKHFDWVLLDTPPVGLLPDAQLLARLTRAVVLVIAANVTSSESVERAVAELGADCIIGTVLNRVEDRRIPQAQYYQQYGTYNTGQ